MTKKIIFTAELIDRIRNRMDDIRYSEENRADLDEVFAEWRRLKTIETEISVLVAEGSNGDVGSEYLLECMENMLVGGPYERRCNEDYVRVGPEDARGKSRLVVCCDGLFYEGKAFRDGKMTTFPMDVPEKVVSMVHEYFRMPKGETNWGLLA